MPGRKSDVLDCQWLQQLHTYGLLSGAFRPEAEIRCLRSYLRQRTMLVEYASHHIQHMQKALTQMNELVSELITIIGANVDWMHVIWFSIVQLPHNTLEFRQYSSGKTLLRQAL